MQLFLVRHAEAVAATPTRSDSDRHLSPAGRSAAAQMGERMRWYDCVPTAVWTSPLIRAVQTAELFVAAMQWAGTVECEPELAPGGAVRDVAVRLAELPATAVVMAFGHEPGISGLGALVTRRHDFPGMRKAEVIRIDDGVIRWTFTLDDPAPVVVA